MSAPVRQSRGVRLVPIEPGAGAHLCRNGCGTLIYFSVLNPRTQKRQPLDLKHPNTVAPTSSTYGFGEPHQANCSKLKEAART